MVMEYVSKGSLYSVLRKDEKITYNDQLDMMITGCRGLVYLESKNIIHRDLSARNLLVTKENDRYVCKISDVRKFLRIFADFLKVWIE
jgi:serine/threonine protein kinase